MSNQELALFAAALGTAALTAGVLVRTGRLRGWLWTYWDTSMPSAQRAGALLLLPAGVIILVGVLGAAMEATGLSPLGIALTFAALLAFIVVMPVVMSRPPSWLKPRWLRDLEARATADPALRSRLSESRRHEFARRDYRLAWTLLLSALVASIVLSWPPVVLIGIGVASAALYARRPRSPETRGD